MKNKWKDLVLLLFIIFLAGFVRLVFVNNEALWLDEGYSLEYAGEGSVSDTVTAVIENNDSHPPLYYVMLNAWENVVDIPYREAMGRIFSFILGMLSVFMAYLLGLRLNGRKLALVFSSSLALSFFAVFYSVEIRMYSLFVFLILSNLYLFFGMLDEWRWGRQILFVLSCVALLYTHYFSLFWTSGIYLVWVLVGREQKDFWKKWLLSGMAVFILFVPWLYIFYGQVVMKLSGGTVNATSWLTLPEPSYNIFGILFEEFFYFQGFMGWFLFLFFVGLGVFAIFKKRLKSNKKMIWFFTIAFFMNLILPYVISVFVSPIIHPRYMQGAYILSLLLVAILISQFKNRIIFMGALSVMIVFNVFVLNEARSQHFHPDWNGFFERYHYMIGPKIMLSPAHYEIPLKYNMKTWAEHVPVETFDYENDDYSEVLSGNFAFIERLSLPEVVEYLRSECKITVEDHFERIGYYLVDCP